MLLSKAKNKADVFFVSHITASAAVLLFWIGHVVELSDFIAGVAAGLILVSTLSMFITRNTDEYTLAMWHAGTSAGFAAIVTLFVANALQPGLERAELADLHFAGLLSVTVYLIAVQIKRWQNQQ